MTIEPNEIAEKLKACPLSGKAVEWYIADGVYNLSCPTLACPCQGTRFHTKDEMYRRWNARPREEAQRYSLSGGNGGIPSKIVPDDGRWRRNDGPNGDGKPYHE